MLTILAKPFKFGKISPLDKSLRGGYNIIKVRNLDKETAMSTAPTAPAKARRADQPVDRAAAAAAAARARETLARMDPEARRKLDQDLFG